MLLSLYYMVARRRAAGDIARGRGVSGTPGGGSTGSQVPILAAAAASASAARRSTSGTLLSNGTLRSHHGGLHTPGNAAAGASETVVGTLQRATSTGGRHQVTIGRDCEKT